MAESEPPKRQEERQERNRSSLLSQSSLVGVFGGYLRLNHSQLAQDLLHDGNIFGPSIR